MDRVHLALLTVVVLGAAHLWLSSAQAQETAPSQRCAAFRKTGAITYVDEGKPGQPGLDLPPGWVPVGGGPEGDFWVVIACREAVAVAP